MNIATKEAIIEAVKEGLRVVFLSVLPIVMSGINDKTGAINIQWNVVIAVALLTLLRFIDKLMYELGKAQKDLGKNSELIKGLTGF